MRRLWKILAGVWLASSLSTRLAAQELQYQGLPDMDEKVMNGQLNQGTGRLLAPILLAKKAERWLLLPILDGAEPEKAIDVTVAAHRLEASRQLKRWALELVGEPLLAAYLKALNQVAWLQLQALSASEPDAAAMAEQIKRWQSIRDRQEEMMARRTTLLSADRRLFIFTSIAEVFHSLGAPLVTDPSDPDFSREWQKAWASLRASMVGRLSYDLHMFGPERRRALQEYLHITPNLPIFWPVLADVQARITVEDPHIVGVRASLQTAESIRLEVGLSEEGWLAFQEHAGPMLLPIALQASLRYSSADSLVATPVMSQLCLISEDFKSIKLCS